MADFTEVVFYQIMQDINSGCILARCWINCVLQPMSFTSCVFHSVLCVYTFYVTVYFMHFLLLQLK